MVLDSELHGRIEAINKITFLDDQPSIEGPSVPLSCDPALRLNYQDRNAFDTHWIEETAAMEKFVRKTTTHIT